MTELSWMVTAILLSAVVVVFGFTILGALVSGWTARNMIIRGEMLVGELAEERRRLIDYVSNSSTELGAAIDLRKYWKNLKWDKAHQFVILRQPLEDSTLHRAFDQETVIAFAQMFLQKIFSRPPVAVKLNSRDWQRSAMPAHERIHFRDVSGGIIQIGDKNTATFSPSFDEKGTVTLIAALRADGATFEGAEAEQAASFADSLEVDLREKRWSSISTTAATIASFVGSATSVWASTLSVLSG